MVSLGYVFKNSKVANKKKKLKDTYILCYGPSLQECEPPNETCK